MTPQVSLSFPFISQSISRRHPHLDLKQLIEHPQIGIIIHPQDVAAVQQCIQNSLAYLTRWNQKYGVLMPSGSVAWHWAIVHQHDSIFLHDLQDKLHHSLLITDKGY